MLRNKFKLLIFSMVVLGLDVAAVAQTPKPLKQPEPPAVEGVEWMKVPFEKAENELLRLLKEDLPKLEEKAMVVSVYQVTASGNLPNEYQKNFKTKMERVLLASRKLKIKPCTGCGESRLIKSESGEIRYESQSTDVDRMSKVGSQLGVDHMFMGEVTYTPEDLQMRVRMIRVPSGELEWSKEYSTADVIKSNESLDEAGRGDLGHQDSLSRVMIGEVALTISLSPGLLLLPTVDSGSGSEYTIAPNVDLFIGEHFDRMRKLFGFQIGGMFNLFPIADHSTPVPWAVRTGPKFGYCFNPYNVTTARFSVTAEFGGLLSTGYVSGYFGAGPEVSMIRRFSVSVIPIYIIPRSVAGSETLIQQSGGGFTSSGKDSVGKLGGLGGVVKVNFNW